MIISVVKKKSITMIRQDDIINVVSIHIQGVATLFDNYDFTLYKAFI